MLVWRPANSADEAMQRYGSALAASLAATSAGHLIHKDRIELAVIANDIAASEEVSGVAFYDTQHNVLALAGDTELAQHYTASASLDDTITGFVVVALEAQVFAPPSYLWQWLVTLLVLLCVPFAAMALVQLSTRGNRALPIVSVPEPRPPAPQDCISLTVNIHNQFGMTGEAKRQILEDALTMAREVCAVYSGVAATLDNRGIVILFDRSTVSPTQTLLATFLLQKLLQEFETEGEYRCHLSVMHAPSAPGEMPHLDVASLDREALDHALLAAALCKPDMVLLSTDVYTKLDGVGREWTVPYTHPLLDEEGTSPHYCISNLPTSQATLIDNQAEIILGFNQASA